MALFFNHPARFRTLFLTVAFILFSFLSALAQQTDTSFAQALALYQKGDFAKSAVMFDKIHTERALLFSGKSYYNLKDYATARNRLLTVQKRNNRQLSEEAKYTLSLLNIRNKNFTDALLGLYELMKNSNYPRLSADSEQLYNDILNYLSFEQRLEVMENTNQDSLLYDLSRTAMGRVDYEEAKILFTKMKKTVTDIPDTAINQAGAALRSESEYMQLKRRTKFQPLPGLTYTIGVALPSFSAGQREYRIARGLYKGIMLAAEEFNRRHSSRVTLSYQNTGAKADSAQQALEALAKRNADAIIGPLFSEQAQTMARVAGRYKTPILAPLANSQFISNESGYLYQMNPTFEVHGKVMARFVNEKLDTNRTAVLAQQNTMGELSAEAFRKETKRLEGAVPDYFVKNMGPDGYQLSTYVRYITEKNDADSVSAIYAPFTGNNSATLVDLLLRQLNSLESNLPVFGSPEWSNANISAENKGARPIFFTESFYTKPSNYRINRFKSSYRGRFNEEPNRFSLIGYDAASYLLRTLDRVVNPALLQRELAKQPLYEGLITNIDFDGTNINQKLMVFEITADGLSLVSE